jgi:hypothetical protein
VLVSDLRSLTALLRCPRTPSLGLGNAEAGSLQTVLDHCEQLRGVVDDALRARGDECLG